MSKKVVGVVTALTLVLGLAGSSIAHRHGDGKGECDKVTKCDKKSSSCEDKKCILKKRKECVCFYLKHSTELGLSEDQIAKLKQLKIEAKKVKLHNKADIKVLKLEIDALLDAKKPDQDAINSKIDKISQLKAALKKACFNASLRAREVLTEEQYKLSKTLDKVCPLPEGRKKKCDKMKDKD